MERHEQEFEILRKQISVTGKLSPQGLDVLAGILIDIYIARSGKMSSRVKSDVDHNSGSESIDHENVA